MESPALWGAGISKSVNPVPHSYMMASRLNFAGNLVTWWEAKAPVDYLVKYRNEMGKLVKF